MAHAPRRHAPPVRANVPPMQVVRDHRDARAVLAGAGAAIAIGNFDGVHVGHLALIARARALALAAASPTRTAVLTFDPHPSSLLSPRGAPPPVASLARRLELLAAAGVEVVIVEPFTAALAARTADAFFDEILVAGLDARAIVVGYDFRYGHGRAGTIETLRARGAAAGVAVAVVPSVEVDGIVASSTKVRTHLAAGEMGAAAQLLGRPYDVDGVVVHGAKRGRTIGVPTANLAVDAAAGLPIAPGIYAVTLASVHAGPLPAVASLGTNPTFVASGALVLEVHILDFDGDLYDQRVRVAFHARLRDEARYDGIEPLLAQITIDIAQAREILGARRG